MKPVREIERELIAELQNGNDNAMAELCHLHHRFVWRCARIVESKVGGRLRGECLDIEDLVQVGIIQLMRGALLFDLSRATGFLSYAGRHIYVEMVRELRRTERRANWAQSLNFEDDEVKPIPSKDDTFETVCRREHVEIIRHTIRHLAPKTRRVMAMRLKGMSRQQVGSVVGVTRERVRRIEKKSMKCLAFVVSER